jgi:hypothetical protein
MIRQSGINTRPSCKWKTCEQDNCIKHNDTLNIADCNKLKLNKVTYTARPSALLTNYTIL